MESQSRQVVVFTHDIVFLLALSDLASELGVDVMHQRLRRDQLHSGLISRRYRGSLCQSTSVLVS